MSPIDVVSLVRIESCDSNFQSVDSTWCNRQLSDEILVFLARHQPSLHTLKLAGCKSISIVGLSSRFFFFSSSYFSLSYVVV